MRKKRNYKREHEPDLKYNNIVVGRFINVLMHDGKRSVAESVVYKAFDIIKEKTKKDPIKLFETALANVQPLIEVSTKRIGGANYQVPRDVRPTRQFMLATRWMIGAARSKSGSPMSQRLAEELMAAANNEGTAVKKKQDVHKMAEANRAFAHFSR